MIDYTLFINILTSTFVKFADRKNLKNFCIENKFKLEESSFTRKRIFSLDVLLAFILYPKTHSLFVDGLAFLDGVGAAVASAAAFVKRRGLIPDTYIRAFHRELVSRIYTEGLARGRWNGRLLLAADGTTYSIPNTKALKDYFMEGRKAGGTSKQPLARDVAIKDVVNDLVLAANMMCYGKDEIKLFTDLAKDLPKVVRDMSPVIIFDRKFCAYTLLECLVEQHLDYIIRVKRGFNSDVDEFLDSDEKEKIVVLQPGCTTRKKLRHMYGHCTEKIRVRLVRCSENIVVMTSLLDDQTVIDDTIPIPGTDIKRSFSDTDIDLPVKDTYRLRWTDETTIGFLKNNLEIEIFSGTRVSVLYQDFYSKLINYNIVTLLSKAAAQMRHPRKEPEHELGIDRNKALGVVYVRLWKSLVLNKLNESWTDMLKQIGRNTCAIIPDRHVPRVFRRIKSSGKYITFTNYKEAI